jgi:hypothetical protein
VRAIRVVFVWMIFVGKFGFCIHTGIVRASYTTTVFCGVVYPL